MTHTVTAPTVSQLADGRKNSWRVRWRVDGRPCTKHFPTKTAALAFLSKVNSARSAGRDFDEDSGAPLLNAKKTKSGPTFAEAAVEVLAASWDNLMSTSRRSLAEGFAQVIGVTCTANVERARLYAGLRPAEAIGLRWSGVDLKGRRLLISETTPHAGKRFTDWCLGDTARWQG